MFRQIEWRTEDYLTKEMAKHHCYGMSLCEIQNYEIVWQKALGTRTMKAADAVLPDTLFQAGSISKALFSLAVMHLVQEESLELDKDVNEYLKAWQLPASIGIAAHVTLRQLLSHTASTTVHGFPGYEIDEPIPSLLQILEGAVPANTLPIRIDGMPGQRYQYSGGGSCIAQLVVEEITQCIS